MGHALLTAEQIKQLVYSWENSPVGSEEKKLIEDLFLITGTPMPSASDLAQYEAA